MTSQHHTGTHPFLWQASIMPVLIHFYDKPALYRYSSILHRYVYTHIYTYLCTYIYFPEGMFTYFFTWIVCTRNWTGKMELGHGEQGNSHHLTSSVQLSVFQIDKKQTQCFTKQWIKVIKGSLCPECYCPWRPGRIKPRRTCQVLVIWYFLAPVGSGLRCYRFGEFFALGVTSLA